ncbi:ATP-binding protein [Holdemanella sp.]|uniref:ATP-binding protein n=1 Tax=Holdemanella sp. TaxID=1971762 RepID=UPI00307A7FD8
MRELNWVYYYSNVEKDQNQYTHEECTRVGPVDAKYVKSSNRDFNNNPFIEALPRPRDGNVLLNAYTVPIPSLDADDLSKMSVNEQKATVVSLKNLRLPLSFQKQLEFINYDVIVSSYMLRKSYVWDTNAIGESTDKKLIKMKGKIEDSAPSGFALLGYSGCGKSSSLKQLFDNIPQVIMHHPDPGTSIPQITYLVVSCMPNSNFSTLYRQIGEAIDNALGNPEPIYEVMINKKCKSLADKQLKVCQLIEMFSIGTIVMDEIQLIDFNSNRENSYEGLLGIVNKTKVALSVVGTDEAYKKLFTMLRNARRAGDFIDASAYTTDKDYFNMLVNMLLTWQWLDTPIQWSKELSDTLYECSGGIINMLIWLYKWIMLEYIDSKSKGKIETIDKKFIVRVNNKHFKQLKGAIDIVNQARTEELEDERILTIAEEEKNKYQMPESNISNMVYESKMMTKVIDLVREIYVEFDSDSIGRATRMVLEEDVNHRLKPHEVAKQVIAILNEEPVKPKRKVTRRTPASKNICDYITDDN